jgi:hypothetical protein
LTAVRGWVSSRWSLAGVAVGLLLPIVAVLGDVCGAAEAVFGITLLGAIFGAILGYGVRPLFRRAGDFLLGTSVGFASAFVLIFFVAAQFIPC